MVIRILDIVQSADTGDQGAIVFARLHQELVFRLIHLVPAAMCSSSACLPRAFFSSPHYSAR
jgi:hypothetical protein